jgi:hypothetical protein
MTDENVEIKDPKAVLDALERAKTDAQKARTELEAIQAQSAALAKDKTDLEEMVKGLKEIDGVWKAKTKELLVTRALGGNAERVMKFIDMDSITFDEDDKITGIDEAVAKVKADLPELFDPKRRVGGAADLFDKGEPVKAASGTEAQVKRLFNKG